MSVQDTNAHAIGTASAATSAGAAPSASFSGSRLPPTTSLMGLSSFGINRNSASEILSAAKNLTMEALKEMPVAGMSQRLLPIDTAQFTDLWLPSLVIMLLDEGNKILGYHVLVLEAGGQPLEPENVGVNGVNVPVERYSERVYDTKYASIVRQVVASSHPDYKIAKSNGTAEIVPRTFSFENKVDLRELLVNAMSAALLDVRTANESFPVINLADPAARDGVLNAAYQFGASQLRTPGGLPVRADLRAQLSASPLEKPASNTVNQGDQRIPFGQACGFIDFLWAPKAALQGPLGMQAQQSTQRFDPHIVLTKLEGLINMALPIQLLTLASLYNVAENGGWYGYFRPSLAGMSGGGKNMKNIGALNIEGNLQNEPNYGSWVDTSTQTFNDHALAMLLNGLVSPQAIMSLDVAITGHDSFYNDVFSEAAQGNMKAQQAILAAANELTGGEFGQLFQGNEAMISSAQLIPMGYYSGKNGLSDIRDFDYLAVMNLVGTENPEFGSRWTQAWTDMSRPLPLRIQQQHKMLMELSGQTAVFTGNAIRSTFRGDFMTAFMKALGNVGVKFNVSNPTIGGEFTSTRASFDWLNAARLSTGISNAFNQGYTTAQGNNAGIGFGVSGASRW